MRKLIVNNIISQDGYYHESRNPFMTLFNYRWEVYPTDDCCEVYNTQWLCAADTLLLGRVSYEDFRGYWPFVADDPHATPLQRETARLNNTISKIVISDSLTPGETTPWHDTTHIIRRAEAYQQIAALKGQSGKDILILGSHTLWKDLLAHGLVDELHLMIDPVVTGAGRPILDGELPVSLRLINTRACDRSDNVLARYTVRHEGD